MTTSNDKNGLELFQKSGSILDLLRHEITSTISTERTLKRIEKTLMNPELLRTLSFEQIIQYMDRLLRRQKEGKEFIIDFYRVTSKSQDIQNVLKQYTMINGEESKVIEGEVVSSESELTIKKALLSKLDQLVREREEANIDE